MLRGAEAKVPAAEAAAIVKLVDDLNKNISDLDEIKKIAGGIRSTLQTTVGHTYAPNVEVESSMPNELDRLFQRLALQVGDPLDVNYLVPRHRETDWLFRPQAEFEPGCARGRLCRASCARLRS